MWGFYTLKDFLDVIFIPLVLVGIGAWLPAKLERLKTNARKTAFVNLIYRELQEMGPRDPKRTAGQKIWADHLQKRFIHEEIFRNPSENRDFILSLEPDLTYFAAQLWIHFDKAKGIRDEEVEKNEQLDDNEMSALADHGVEWSYFLKEICLFIDRDKNSSLFEEICKPWRKVIIEYHPEKKEIVEKNC